MSTIYFEARRIPEFTEHINPSKLDVGEIYFNLEYADENLLIPELRAYVFIGRNLGGAEEGRLYFQDCSSYFQGQRFDASDAENDMEIRCFLEQQYSGVYDYSGALNELLRCSLRRDAATDVSS